MTPTGRTVNNVDTPTKTSTDEGAGHSNQNKTQTFDLAQLQLLVSQMVTQQSQQMFDRLTQSTSHTSNDVDQKIDKRYLNDLHDMDRIPDVVKSLREFSGQPGEFSSWKKSVDRILKIYESLKGTPKYFGMLSVIRNKITGQADTALESYNTPLNWERISKCLTMHYADKRDLGTLEYQMTTLVQKQHSIPEFYQEVYQHLSLILNKLSSIEMCQEAMDAMTQSYRDKALDTFVRGLKGDLPRLLSIRGPIDLPEALHLCLKLENVQYRIQHSHGNTNNRLPQFTQPPPIVTRKNTPFQPYPTYNTQMRNFYPELLHSPRIFSGLPKQYPNNYQSHPSNHHRFPPTFRPTQPPPTIPNRNQFPRPQPMEVDQSTQSRQVNYQNKPPMNSFAKRTHSGQHHSPAKLQRIYHSEQQDANLDINQYQDQLNEYSSQYDQTLIEYTDAIDNPAMIEEVEDGCYDNEQTSVEQPDYINFLD